MELLTATSTCRASVFRAFAAGYNCAYKKQMNAVVILNSTLYNFSNKVSRIQTTFINVVAAAEGVSQSQVQCHQQHVVIHRQQVTALRQALH